MARATTNAHPPADPAPQTPTPQTPAARRRQARIQERRTAILSAALKLFSTDGMNGTSIERIAEVADLSKTNVFYYFQSKEDIYQTILRDLLVLWLEPLRAVTAEGDPFAMLGDYIARKLVSSRDHPEASRLFCLEMVRGAPLLHEVLRRDLEPLMAEKAAIVQAWVEAGRIAPVDPYHLFFAIWATTQHYADFSAQVRAVTGQGLDDPDFLARTTASVQALLLDGLRPDRHGPPNAQLPSVLPGKEAVRRSKRSKSD